MPGRTVYRLSIPLRARPDPISQERLKTINGLWSILCTLIDETNADLLKGARYNDTNWRLVTHAKDYPPPVVVMNESDKDDEEDG